MAASHSMHNADSEISSSGQNAIQDKANTRAGLLPSRSQPGVVALDPHSPLATDTFTSPIQPTTTPLLPGPSGPPSGSASQTQAPPSVTDAADADADAPSAPNSQSPSLETLPNELLFQILGYLDVNDLLATSRVNHHFRNIAVTPILHSYRLQHNRAALPPLLTSPSRPTLLDLQARSIFLTHTSVVSRRLARSLVSIRLSRRLAARPTAESLVERAVLPPECLPSGSLAGVGMVHVAPALVARRKMIERERVKDGLRRWVGSVWRGQVSERSERVRRREEMFGVGRVWRLCRFWERVAAP